MPSAAAARAYNASQAPTIADPVAVFVGGTNGIGRAMASAFAQHTSGRARIVIIGRDQAAADALRATLPSPAREQLAFLACDMRLMRNVAAATRELAARGVTKINYLVLSAGVLPARARSETEEGLDERVAVAYYGRWKFVHDLQPQLSAARAAGEPAKVTSENYSLVSTPLTQATYNDLMLAKFAELHPEMSFVHSYPGMVRTGALANASSLAVRTLNCVLYPFMMIFGNSPEDCAELMWYAIYQSRPGFARVNSRGEDIGMKSYYGTEEDKEKLWEHTLDATRSRGVAAESHAAV